MTNTIHAVVREGRIELLDSIIIPEGTKLLVTPVFEDADFWMKSSESSLENIWNNSEDDRYAELLKEPLSFVPAGTI